MVKDDIFTYILFPIVILGAIYIYFEVNDDFDLKCITMYLRVWVICIFIGFEYTLNF